eukprot:376408_1
MFTKKFTSSLKKELLLAVDDNRPYQPTILFTSGKYNKGRKMYNHACRLKYSRKFLQTVKVGQSLSFQNITASENRFSESQFKVKVSEAVRNFYDETRKTLELFNRNGTVKIR